MNKKIIAGIVIIILFITGLGFVDWEGETQIKQGVLDSIEYVSDTSYKLIFSDGSELTFKEDNAVDTQEMYEYLTGWIGQEMIIEYAYSYWDDEYDLNSVSSVD